MNLHVFAVFDLGSASFGRPIFVRGDGEAMRTFTDEVNRREPGNVMNGHPEHFQLFKLGIFDDSTGRFACPDIPDKVCDAVSVVLREQ